MNAVVQRDFWRNSGYCLLNHDLTGNLVVTDNFLRAYFLRPELRPLDDSPESEVSLHEQLMENPRMGVPLERLLQIPDGDVRDNYRGLP